MDPWTPLWLSITTDRSVNLWFVVVNCSVFIEAELSDAANVLPAAVTHGDQPQSALAHSVHAASSADNLAAQVTEPRHYLEKPDVGLTACWIGSGLERGSWGWTWQFLPVTKSNRVLCELLCLGGLKRNRPSQYKGSLFVCSRSSARTAIVMRATCLLKLQRKFDVLWVLRHLLPSKLTAVLHDAVLCRICTLWSVQWTTVELLGKEVSMWDLRNAINNCLHSWTFYNNVNKAKTFSLTANVLKRYATSHGWYNILSQFFKQIIKRLVIHYYFFITSKGNTL